MVKIVRVFLALFAALWYTTSQVNSNASQNKWEVDLNRFLKQQKVVSVSAKDYYNIPEPIIKYSTVVLIIIRYLLSLNFELI